MNLGEKIEEGILRVKVPIEGSPLKEVNAYLVVSSKKVLIVDPGPNHPLCLIVIETPGHSPGHCCLYEPNKRILFFGGSSFKGNNAKCKPMVRGSGCTGFIFNKLKKAHQVRDKDGLTWAWGAFFEVREEDMGT
jgi:glyoxylase-like metal-dependent hydrolase (beta-lactamase superfamily II)